MKLATLALTLGVALATPAVFAQSGHDMHAMPAAAAHSAPPSEGMVRKIDKAAGKITIAHGPLENLGMPGMTMAFGVSDPAMLDKVKTGDKIRFVADRKDSSFVVKTLETVK